MGHPGVRISAAGAWILVVESGAGHARLTETVLEAAGYEVVSATEPEEIRALLDAYNPDVVVLVEGKTLAMSDIVQEIKAPIVAVSQEDTRDIVEGVAIALPLWRLADGIAELLSSKARDAGQ